MSRSRRGRREYLNDGKTREFMALLCYYFDSIVDVPRVKHGMKQSIGSLINDEITICAKFLRNEVTKWSPRIRLP